GGRRARVDGDAADVPAQAREARHHAAELPVPGRQLRERGQGMKRLALLSALGAAVATTATVAADANEPLSAPRTTRARTASPDRAFVLSLSRPARLAGGAVTVTENGKPVDHFP